MQGLPCEHAGCAYCGWCHVEGCQSARSSCESVRWLNVVEAARVCGYRVTTCEDGVVMEKDGEVPLRFFMSSVGLEAAEEWVTGEALKHLGGIVRLSWWQVAWEGVRWWWRSVFGRKVRCERCGRKFHPEEGVCESDGQVYCWSCCGY